MNILSDTAVIETIMKNSRDTVYFKDRDSRFLLNSLAHALQFGFKDPRDLAGKSDFDIYPENIAAANRTAEIEVMRTGMPVIGRIETAVNAKRQSCTFSTDKYPLYDQEGEIIGTWGISRDITQIQIPDDAKNRINRELEEANARLLTLSSIDEISGLYNQRHFFDMLNKTIQVFLHKRQKNPTSLFSLILMDIDHFKEINDTYGSFAGDTAIRHIAGLLKNHTRGSDICFRYGGDEYAVILPDTGAHAAKDLAGRLVRIIEKNPIVTEQFTFGLTGSMGVVCFDGVSSAQEMIQQGTAQLDKAKKEGRNRVCGEEA